MLPVLVHHQRHLHPLRHYRAHEVRFERGTQVVDEARSEEEEGEKQVDKEAEKEGEQEGEKEGEK